MSKADAVLLVGGGGHCRSVIDVLEMAHVSVAGIIHGSNDRQENIFCHPALGKDEDLPNLLGTYSKALVTVGQIKTATPRKTLFETLKALGFSLPYIVSPLGHCSAHSSLGAGSIVMHHALVNSNVHIGQNCIINSKALVEHDSVVHDHCHIAVGAIICGNVCIGQGTFVGAGACIKEGVTIGENCIIGMNCTVRQNMSSGTKYVG